MTERKPLAGKIVSIPFLAALVLAAVGMFFLVQRFRYGLGAVSNMNDGYPWGIWIAFDVVVGTAIACGGYAMALLVYVFNKGEYAPLVRPALMTSLFGYTMAGVSVFFDVGRYWQMHNVFLPWFSNLHSVMFEVALCIGAYIMVLWVEFAPTFLERLEARKLQHRLNRVIFVFIALGILLPTMHQSSLGTMMLMAGYKLSPLWWTPFLPLLFLLTAIIMGFGIVVIESLAASLWFDRPLEIPLLEKLAGIMPWLLGAYLVIRLEDVNLRGYMGSVFDGNLEGNMFLTENTLLFLALFILASPTNRSNPRMLFIAAASLVIGGAVYRFNTYIVGFDPGTGWQYFPSVPEMLITLGVLAAEVIAYFWFVNKLPVLPKLEHA